MEVLRKVFDPIPVSRVEVSGALHLKSVCSLASPGKIAVCTSNESAKCIVQVADGVNLYPTTFVVYSLSVVRTKCVIPRNLMTSYIEKRLRMIFLNN